MTPPADRESSTRFFIDDGSAADSAFVNPYTGKVLGDSKPDGGLVGLANRLHGYLNNSDHHQAAGRGSVVGRRPGDAHVRGG